MIILKPIEFTIEFKYGKMSVEVELPRANMVIDPRPNHSGNISDGPRSRPFRFQCEYHDNGTTVTLTRPDDIKDWSFFFSFRVYDPATETVPSFDSMIYTYMGEDNEKAPDDTTVLIIHPSVRVIKSKAFSHCKKIKKCFMHDGVHTIKSFAFGHCSAMKVIRLSQTLTHIGMCAFEHCWSLEAVFLPPTVKKIDTQAFSGCYNLRIFPFPPNIDTSKHGKGMLYSCNEFFKTTEIDRYSSDYDYDYNDAMEESKRVHQTIIRFYRDQVPPLHKACLDTHVTHQTIQQSINTHGQATASITDHDGMTPLHIMAMNPHADISALRACFDLNMGCALVGDSRGNTPLDYLRVHRDTIEDHTSLVSSLCMHRDAAAAGLSQDRQETWTNMNKKRKRVK